MRSPCGPWLIGSIPDRGAVVITWTIAPSLLKEATNGSKTCVAEPGVGQYWWATRRTRGGKIKIPLMETSGRPTVVPELYPEPDLAPRRCLAFND